MPTPTGTGAARGRPPFVSRLMRRCCGGTRNRRRRGIIAPPICSVRAIVSAGPQSRYPGRLKTGPRYQPNRVVVGVADPAHPPLPDMPLLQQRDLINSQPAAYVCEHYACQLPVTDAAGLAAQLDG